MSYIKMNSTSCSGCKACLAVCRQNAITFTEDSEGFHIPVVNQNKCVGCGLCVKHCPALNYKKTKTKCSPKAFALQYHNEPIRKNSASGALFPAFANLFIHILHGYVCGCILDDDLVVKHIVSNKWADVERMQDSKYVQSDMGTCIAEIITLLKDGQYILFSGTSCQVNGLLSAASLNKVNTSKLLTVDFFCHGVPSPKVWKDYVNYQQLISKKKFDGYRFRNKTYGWGKGTQSRRTGFLSTWKYSGTYHEYMSLSARIWPRIFFSNLCLRGYCHNCPYTSVDKPADVTMGDFWGVEDFHPHFDDHLGCSLAVVRNEKAEELLRKLENTELLEVSVEDVIKKQGNAFAPSHPHTKRGEFWEDYKTSDFEDILRNYFGYTSVGILKARIKYILFKLKLRKYSY